MRTPGNAFTPAVQNWLAHYAYDHPLLVRDPRARLAHDRKRAKLDRKRAELAHILARRVHERKRAALVARVVARRLRVDALVELRVRALKSSAHKWPRPPCHSNDKEQHQRLKVREEERRKATRDTTERAAADARVAALMQLRAAGANRRRIYY